MSYRHQVSVEECQSSGDGNAARIPGFTRSGMERQMRIYLSGLGAGADVISPPGASRRPAASAEPFST